LDGARWAARMLVQLSFRRIARQQDGKARTLAGLTGDGGEPGTRTPDQRIMIRGNRKSQRHPAHGTTNQSMTYLFSSVATFCRFPPLSVPPVSHDRRGIPGALCGSTRAEGGGGLLRPKPSASIPAIAPSKFLRRIYFLSRRNDP